MTRRISAVALTACALLAITTSLGRAEVPARLVLEGLVFEVGSAELAAGSDAYLDEIAAMLLAEPVAAVEVGGHTDSSGPADLNRDLSRRRAETVRNDLVRRGVAADRITAVGYGEDYPVADNATAAGRAANRRVELQRTDS